MSLTGATLAVWPTVTVVERLLAFDCTATKPRSTVTDAPSWLEVTTKCVPLTTAARNCVSTTKCGAFSTSASTSTLPKSCCTVVKRASVLSWICTCVLAPSVTTSLPRCRSTWPSGPVRTVRIVRHHVAARQRGPGGVDQLFDGAAQLDHRPVVGEGRRADEKKREQKADETQRHSESPNQSDAS